MSEPTKAELQVQLKDATARATSAEAALERARGEATSAGERADQLAAALKESEADRDGLAKELTETKASLRAYKGSATKARSQVEVLQREKSPTARSLGAMPKAKSEQEASDRAVAVDLAFAAGFTEVAFSDGKRELRELAPLSVDSGAWQLTPTGRVLEFEPILEPGNCERRELPLRGFALLDETGEQVAYHALPEPIIVPSGARVQIPRGCIRF